MVAHVKQRVLAAFGHTIPRERFDGQKGSGSLHAPGKFHCVRLADRRVRIRGWLADPSGLLLDLSLPARKHLRALFPLGGEISWRRGKDTSRR